MANKARMPKPPRTASAIAEVKTVGPKALKALSDPLRVHRLEALVGEPRTVKALAVRLQVSPTRLFYHINLLIKHGLVRVASAQIVSGIIEKHYQATTRHFKMDRSLLSGDSTSAGRATVANPARSVDKGGAIAERGWLEALTQSAA